MKNYFIDLTDNKKDIYSGHIKLGGTNPNGDKISFTNYYMELNGEPFFGISGEFHFSRCHERFWEDEIIKMKMGGINIVSTYIFWNHHEEEENIFEWSGNRNLRRFVELCGKQGLYVIIRIGPFCHGECRNGGLPDWLFGRPFEIRSNEKEYLFYVRRFYTEIGKQVNGLLYKDGGPVIATQIENEYMHSAAPWEMTTGTSNEWVPGGKDGDSHMKKLKSLAIEAGLKTPIYTCTAWGGAAAPVDEMLPLWGGYAFWPWIFYGDAEEHPVTPEFIFRDYHNSTKPKCYNFEPKHDPESYPYACCEMGGGMNVSYKYRFVLPYESVPAMAVVKAAGGCNFIGYYMYHGGSNPKGKKDTYLNEHSMPKISYDFQAPVGEFGQLRESYKELKLQHYFYKDFEKELCLMKTVLPRDTDSMDPENLDELRFAARVNGESGFIFINNYQDHMEPKEQSDFSIQLKLGNENNIRIPENGSLNLGKGACCILPFNLNIGVTLLNYSTAQLITAIEHDGEKFYFFFTPDRMTAEYCFSEELKDIRAENAIVEIAGGKTIIHINDNCSGTVKFTAAKGQTINICTLKKEQAVNFWKVNIRGCDRVIITQAGVLASEKTMKFECARMESVNFSIFPDAAPRFITGAEVINKFRDGIFTAYELKLPKIGSDISIKKIKSNKAVIKVSEELFSCTKEVILKIDYIGDIGYAFIDGELIHDNFCNGKPWEIGLKRFEKEILDKGMYIYVSPLKTGSTVKSDSVMAARMEINEGEIAEINSIAAVPVYEIIVS
jgi:hypothetical protein